MEKRTYENCSADELATDPAFRRWCLNPTTEGQNFWNTFLYQHPEAEERIEIARRAVLGAQRHFGEKEADPQLLKKRYDFIVEQAKTRRGRKRTRYAWLQAAAAVLIILFLTFAVVYRGSSEEPFTEQLVYRTDYGDRQTVQLPDGSTVELNAGSELSLSDSWEAGGDRVVLLKGEAYFLVAKAPGPRAKFVVRTGELSVEVLGTRFNVNASGGSTQVVLDEGRVRLSRADRGGKESLIMAPGEVAVLQRDAPAITIERVEDAPSYSSWKEGYLTYRDTPLDKVLEDIGRTFGYTVVMGDAQLEDEAISGALPTGDLDEALAVLKDIVPGISFQRGQNNLIVGMQKSN